MREVAVVGGGAVGACTAALLAQGGLGVTLFEPHAPAPTEPGAPLDTRVVALSRASERILRAAGAWEHLVPARVCAYERMRVWTHGGPLGPGAIGFDAAEVGEPNLGYILEGRLLQQALLAALRAHGGRLVPAALERLEVTEDAVVVTTREGTHRAALVVGADGARSLVRSLAGLPARVSGYGQTALIANVATAQPHARTAWQRFLGDGTLAFLPLADGTSSIVWSADEPRAQALAAASDAEFGQELERAAESVLGATRLVSQRRAHPLTRLQAQHYVAPRVALVGDAAHVVHPLAGQGANLGLLDAAALAQLVLEGVARREDPGALSGLRAYERWRRSELALMAQAIEFFDRNLAHGSGALTRLAQHGLGVVNRSAPLKRLLIRSALGTSGELPRAAC